MILCPPMRAGGNGGSRFVDPARGKHSMLRCFTVVSPAAQWGNQTPYSKQIRNSGMQPG
jgi:hypothetical protein